MRIRGVLIRRHRVALTALALALMTLGVAAACSLTGGGAERENAIRPADRAALPALLAAGPFRIHHDLADVDALAYRQLLDRSQSNFHAVMAGAGFDLHPPAAPLTWLLFADEAGYRAHEQRTPGRDVTRSSGGYYSSRRNQVVVFHGSAGHHVRRTLHEAAHQLAFNTGVQKRTVTYPFWFAEGLATSFEAATVDAAWGPGSDNPRRQAAAHWALRHDRLMPLRRFVTLGQLQTEDRRERTLRYAQAWSLFRFLFQERLEQLRAYAQAMNARSPGRLSEHEHAERFMAAFGDPAVLEAAYRRHLAGH
jgi:hypothetical protein